MSLNFVGACVSALDLNQDAVLAYGTTHHIDHDGRPLIGRGHRMLPSIEDHESSRRFHLAVTNAFWTIDQELYGVFRSSALRKSTLHRPYFGSDHAVIKEMALLGRFVHVPNVVFYNRVHPDRGSQIADPTNRLRWTDSQAQNKRAFESCKHLMHLIEIAIRHRRVASPAITLMSVIGWAFSPRQFSRCMLELLGVILPNSGEEEIRRLIRSVVYKRYPPPSFEIADDLVVSKE